ncbi:MAG: ABC transporter permease [Chloroflexota bacterium]|nr:ABC transporter permease [Chloroflexota bacterium]
MSGYILKRLVLVIPVLFGVSIVAFLMSHLVPGDPVVVMLGERATAEDADRLREELGFNDPLHVQYLRYVGGVVQGDLGTSIRSGQPVLDEIVERFPSTLTLTFSAVVVATVVGVTLGVASSVARSSWVDSAIMGVALMGISVPTFWSGILMILLFGLYLEWLPIVGTGPVSLIMPTIVLAAPAAAVLARITRSTMLEVLGVDFVRSARAKGLRERVVIVRHVLPNALIPVITIIGLQFGGLLSGSVIVESVFTRPGLGRYTITAIQSRDFPQIQGIVLVVAAIYVIVNLGVDLLYAVFDPRIRYE